MAKSRKTKCDLCGAGGVYSTVLVTAQSLSAWSPEAKKLFGVKLTNGDLYDLRRLVRKLRDFECK